MIIGLEKINGCDKRIEEVVQCLYEVFHHIIITSGFRKGDPKYHGKGLAVDVSCSTAKCYELATEAIRKFPEIHGVGIDVYKQYCHLDFRTQTYVDWVYDAKGNAIYRQSA